MADAPPFVLVEHPRPHVAVVRMHRPDRLNAMSIELVSELHDALDVIAEENDTWVVVLTGSGRAFSSGLDLKDHGIVPNIDGLQVGRIAQRAMRHYSRLVPRMRRMPQPVIAAEPFPDYNSEFFTKDRISDRLSALLRKVSRCIFLCLLKSRTTKIASRSPLRVSTPW